MLKEGIINQQEYDNIKKKYLSKLNDNDSSSKKFLVKYKPCMMSLSGAQERQDTKRSITTSCITLNKI